MSAQQNNIQLQVEDNVTSPIVSEQSMDAMFRKYVAERKPNLIIMTPCYNSTVFVSYMQSLIQTLFACKEYGIKADVIFCRNDSLVSRARNNLVAKAMHADGGKATHFLFIDADITWSPIDVFKLLMADKPLVGGIYPIKNYRWNTLTTEQLATLKQRYKRENVSSAMSEEDFIKTNLVRYNINYENNFITIDKNLTKVKHLATGFMMIQRKTFETMFTAYPKTKYTDDVSFLEGDENRFAYALFDCGVEFDHYFSEDWMFCHRWQKLGGEIFVDVSINLDHSGIETYKGCYLASVI